MQPLPPLNTLLQLTSPERINKPLELKDGDKVRKVTVIFLAALNGEANLVDELLNEGAVIKPGRMSLAFLRWAAASPSGFQKYRLFRFIFQKTGMHVNLLRNQTLKEFREEATALKQLVFNNGYNISSVTTSSYNYYSLVGFKGDLHHIRQLIRSTLKPESVKAIAEGAVAGDNVDVLELLHKECSIDLATSFSRKELSFYLEFEHQQFKLLGYMHSLGIDLDAPMNDKQNETFVNHYEGWTVAYMAVFHGNSKALECLHKLKINLNRPTAYGLTPVYFATILEDVNCLETLQKLGVDLKSSAEDFVENPEVAPSYIAIKNQKRKLIEFFTDEPEAVVSFWEIKEYCLTPFLAILLLREPNCLKAFLDGRNAATVKRNDGRSPDVNEVVADLYQERNVTKPDKAIQMIRLLIERGICDYKTLLCQLSFSNITLFYACLNPIDATLARVFTEEKLLEKALGSKRSLPKGKALLRYSENECTQITFEDLSHLIRERIDLVITKGGPILPSIQSSFTKLSQRKFPQGYQFAWEPHKIERLLAILEDLEKVAIMISQTMETGSMFKRSTPATYELIDEVKLADLEPLSSL